MSLKSRGVRRLFLTLVVLAIALFLSSGSWLFWQAWLYLILMSVFWTYFYVELLKRSPDVIERRLQRTESEREQKLFQKLFTPILLCGFIVSGLDFRSGWSRALLRPVPLAVVITGQLLVVLSYCFVFWVLQTNAYAGATIQVEAAQRVVSTGPYAIVRHPMYLGMIVAALASPLALGSHLALPLFASLPAILTYRLIHEETVLRRDLAGYSRYCERTRSRLLPYVW
jgi:protein-S-isoprenylcysteine O-methyltransferase Ste14